MKIRLPERVGYGRNANVHHIRVLFSWTQRRTNFLWSGDQVLPNGMWAQMKWSNSRHSPHNLLQWKTLSSWKNGSKLQLTGQIWLVAYFYTTHKLKWLYILKTILENKKY